MQQFSDPPRSPALAGLVLAGAAFVMTLWLAWDRFRPAALHGDATPRAIEPRGALADFETATIAIFERCAPSVVHVTSRARQWAGYGWTMAEGTGTGFVWDARGYIVTNYHVVQGVRSDVIVRFQGLGETRAAIVGVNKNFDIAVLRVTDPPAPLTPIALGTSADLRVGQSVFAIGNPFGLDHTLTSGIVSALNREIRTENATIQGAIQVDAAINPGNSGGPLLDSAGRLIGMNTAIYSKVEQSSGIGFAVPVDMINREVPRLIRGEQSTPPTLGISVGTVPVRLPDGSVHLLVEEVFDGGGAAAAGMRGRSERTLGDVIVSIDGTAVRSIGDLQSVLETKQFGQTVKVRILRDTGAETLDFRALELDVTLLPPKR